jgi:hypothetical protein
MTKEFSSVLNIRQHLSLIPTPSPGMRVAKHCSGRDDSCATLQRSGWGRRQFPVLLPALSIISDLAAGSSLPSWGAFTREQRCIHMIPLHKKYTVDILLHVLKLWWKQSAHIFQLNWLSTPSTPQLWLRSLIRSENIFVVCVYVCIRMAHKTRPCTATFNDLLCFPYWLSLY